MKYLIKGGEKVTSANIFEAMIQNHYRNLQASLPHLKERQLVDKDGTPIGEGENPYYLGVYLVYDGEKILETAAKRMVRKTAFRETLAVSDRDEFLRYFDARSNANGKEADVVYLYNTARGVITKVKGEFSNGCQGESLDELLSRNLPPNFESEDGSKPVYDTGTKTASAVLTAYALNEGGDKGVRTLVVKRTPYNNLGLGKVAEFDGEGLKREFFFESQPESEGPFIDGERKIVGRYQEWRKEKGELVCVNERKVYVDKDKRLCWERPALEKKRAGEEQKQACFR